MTTEVKISTSIYDLENLNPDNLRGSSHKVQVYANFRSVGAIIPDESGEEHHSVHVGISKNKSIQILLYAADDDWPVVVWMHDDGTVTCGGKELVSST